MRTRSSLTLTFVALTLMLGAQPALATHFDGDPATGRFDPRVEVTIAGSTLVGRPADLSYRITQQDHEDPPLRTELRTPAEWKFPFSTLRAAERTDEAAATSCQEALDNYGNSPNGTGTGTNLDFSKRGDATIARAEKIGTVRLVAAASLSRPGDPIRWDGELAFLSWNGNTNLGRICALLITRDARVTSLPDTDPSSGGDDIESVVEILLDVPLRKVLVNGTERWVATADITETVDNSGIQTAEASLLEFAATFSRSTVGNWNTVGAVPFAVLPEVSGTKIVEAHMTTCSPDPGLINCKSDKAPVARTVPIEVTLPQPSITAPATGEVFTGSAVTVSGTADANATVRVYDATGPLGEAAADASGAWSAPLSFGEGPHAVFARAFDAGGLGPASPSRSFEVDLPPPAPEIVAPLEGDIVGAGNVTISGVAQPGANVKVFEAETLLGTASAAADGRWSTNVSRTEKRLHSLTATAADRGGESTHSVARSFTITTAVPVIVSPAAGAALNTTAVTLQGLAEPGALVTVSDGDLLAGTADADASGSWSLPLTLLEGDHPLRATATNDGLISPVSPQHLLTIDLTAPAAPAIDAPAEGSTVGTRVVPFAGSGEPAARISLVRGSTEIGSALVGPSGTWSAGIPLSDGTHVVHAVATDRAGNSSPASSEVSFTVDVPVLIETPLAGSVNPRLVRFRIVGDPGATQARLYEGTKEIARAPMSGGVAQFSVALSAGSHSVTARTLSGGVLGNPSPVRTFTVDDARPSVSIADLGAAPYVVVPPGGALQGTARDDAAFDSGVAKVRVAFYDPTNRLVATLTADCPTCTAPAVSWSLTPTPALKAGSYRALATAEDAVGNVSVVDTATVVVL